MNIQLIKNGRKWSLYGALLTAIAYSALTLTSQPAYAATCTPALCQTHKNFCTGYCINHGGVRTYSCPAIDSSHWFCQCNQTPPPPPPPAHLHDLLIRSVGK